MNLKRRVESAELAAAKRNGDLNCKLFVKMADESDTEARARLGIDSSTAAIFLTEQDIKI
jgi:hypothetical protein